MAAKFILKLLVEQQKQPRLEIAQECLTVLTVNRDFMKTIISGDEKWVYEYDPETKFQSSQWKHQTSRQVGSNVKVMLTFF